MERYKKKFEEAIDYHSIVNKSDEYINFLDEIQKVFNKFAYYKEDKLFRDLAFKVVKPLQVTRAELNTFIEYCKDNLLKKL
jgi:hypothetical protein